MVSAGTFLSLSSRDEIRPQLCWYIISFFVMELVQRMLDSLQQSPRCCESQRDLGCCGQCCFFKELSLGHSHQALEKSVLTVLCEIFLYSSPPVKK